MKKINLNMKIIDLDSAKVLNPFLTFLLIIILCNTNTFAQSWSKKQIEKANTVKNIDVLTSEEKEIVLYLNLARLYPKQFSKIEVESFDGTKKFKDYLKNSEYKKSLIIELNNMPPVSALSFDSEMYEFAKCFAIESGASGSVGHIRKNCRNISITYGECCSYGFSKGKYIVLQLLIDDGISNLGHRKICLASQFASVGVSISKHKTFEHCAVLDFKLEDVSKLIFNTFQK